MSDFCIIPNEIDKLKINHAMHELLGVYRKPQQLF